MRPLSRIVAGLTLVVISAGGVLAQTGPQTQPDVAALDEDGLVVVYPLLNDTDPEGGALELIAVTSTPAGESRVDGAAVVFTPQPNWHGSVQLTYTVRSPTGEASELILLTVNPVNDSPVAAPDAASVVAGETVAVSVLDNDSDVDGDQLSIASVTSPANGSATVVGNQVRYRAVDDFAGTDLFSYTITDPSGGSASAEVTITVNPATTTTTSVSATTVTPPPTVSSIAPTTAVVTTAPQSVPSTTSTATTAPATTVGTAEVVASGGWASPPNGLVPPGGVGDAEGLLAVVTRNLRSLYLPMLTLLVVGGTAWLLSQRDGANRAKRAIVLIGLSATLSVRERPNREAKVIDEYDGSARQIDVVGRRRIVDGVEWLPVSSAGGRGWVEATYLTEDVARVSFERDVSDTDLVRELRHRLKEGATIATSSRGLIDPETFERDHSRRRLGSRATLKLTALLQDWRATFHIDKTASLAALRPPELRNLHWISFEAPGLDPWQLFFEYHDGRPYPVAALPERVPVEIDTML